MVDDFVVIRTQAGPRKSDKTTIRQTIENEFGSMIRQGKIMKQNFNEHDNCEMLYDVTLPNLKMKLMGK